MRVFCVFWGSAKAIEGAVDVVVGEFEDAGKGGGVGFADAFAVSAGTFGVEAVKYAGVGFGGPGEGVGDVEFIAFVAVVDEAMGYGEVVGVVAGGGGEVVWGFVVQEVR